MSKSRSSLHLVPGILGLSLVLGACAGDEETPKLFDEEGVWSVIRYDLEGSGDLKDIDTMNRRDAFMLSFDSAERIVTAAACIGDANETPASSSCLLTPSETDWDCKCYAYDYVGDQMLWHEFQAGDIPPDVSLANVDDSAPADDESGGGSGAGEDQTIVDLSDIEDVASTFNFLPLPDGLFGSNGVSSRYTFQGRAGSVFDPVFNDDIRETCEPCIAE
ncbi:MAG: hypothetical protein AAF799_15090 [Myxococcota bacterium]